MGKQKKSLDDNMDDVFANWAVGPEAKKNIELYQPDEDSNTSEQGESKVEGQKLNANNRSSKSSPQKRTFKDRPDDPEDVVFTPIDHIPGK